MIVLSGMCGASYAPLTPAGYVRLTSVYGMIMSEWCVVVGSILNAMLLSYLMCVSVAISFRVCVRCVLLVKL